MIISKVGLSNTTVMVVYHDAKKLSISRYLPYNNHNSFDTLLRWLRTIVVWLPINPIKDAAVSHKLITLKHTD